MAVPPEKRQPKQSQPIPARQIKIGGDPESLDRETIAWHFHKLDRPHAHWGWDKLRPADWRDILQHLVAFEGLTWASIKAQAGGRKHGTNHHAIEIEDFTALARNRLTELYLDEFDSLFSLRITNTLRLYGVRDGRVLQLVWHDPYHGSKRGCCPTAK